MADGSFNDLMEALDVQHVLDNEGVKFRRSSTGELNLRECVFCGGSDYKVYLNEKKHRGICFHGTCPQQSFSTFSFVRQLLNTDNRGTFQVLNKYAEETSGFKPSTDRQFNSAPAIPDDWKLPRSTPLPTANGLSISYLLDRRVLLSTQSLFSLRFCHDGYYAYTDVNGSRRRMDFSNRVLIPVTDLDGVVKTFQGRDIAGEAEKRYLFPPMLPGTGRFLYGAHLHQDKEHLVIGEGPFDVMAIHQSIDGVPGFKSMGAVGSFGLSIGSSDEQGDDQLGRLRQLKRANLRTLTFLWDAEKNALNRALSAGMKLRREGFVVRIGLLPAGKDPGDCSTGEVRDAIQEATTLNDQSFIRFSFRSPYK